MGVLGVVNEAWAMMGLVGYIGLVDECFKGSSAMVSVLG